MECANLECGQTSMLNARPAVERARSLLDSSLTATGEDIRTVATQFEKLAAEVDGVLGLTSTIVDSVREDWAQSFVLTARMLDTAARRFIAERARSIDAIGTVSANEMGMIENLLTLTAEQRSIAREARTLGVLASIEVARLGAEGHRFRYVAQELDQFSGMVFSGAGDVMTEANQRRASLVDRRRTFNFSLQKRREHFGKVECDLGTASAAMETALAQLAHVPADFKQCVSAIAAHISSVVEAVQLQDVTRQQIEHVRDALMRISSRIGNCRDQENAIDIRDSAILKVQALQIESAQTSAEQWILRINRCLESILSVSSSDAVAIGAQILAQERSLSAQFTRIEHLEQECEADDAEIEAFLAGLGDLMRISKAHLERSRLARDRMQLLNFNSMIEARHLGSQAAAILEITRNIGRISTAWSTLTDRSGNMLEDMLRSSAQAEEAHRNSTRGDKQNLRHARSQSQVGLHALRDAALIADSNGRKVATAVAVLHDEMAILNQIAERLIRSAAILSDARSEIEQLCGGESFSATYLSAHELQEIESQCAAAYTSELERRILRNALFGEPLPVNAAASMSSEIEMF